MKFQLLWCKLCYYFKLIKIFKTILSYSPLCEQAFTTYFTSTISNSKRRSRLKCNDIFSCSFLSLLNH